MSEEMGVRLALFLLWPLLAGLVLAVALPVLIIALVAGWPMILFAEIHKTESGGYKFVWPPS